VGHFRRVVSVALVGALIAVLAACQQPSAGGGGTAASWSVNPSATDPLISGDAVSTHQAYLPSAPWQNKLALIIPGTSATTLAFTELANRLRASGYHVIVLRYPSSLGTTGACPDAGAATYPDCFREFRSEVVFGSDVQDPVGDNFDHPIAAVNGSNSVVNRLTKLLDHLVQVAPTGGWDKFQRRNAGVCTQVDTTYGGCAVDWTKVTAVGHSQGAGVGLYLAKFFPLSRVVMLSGSFDAYDLGGGSFAVAPWVTEAPLQVAPSDIRTLLHLSDPALGRMRAVENALGVPGAEVNVTSASPPYGSSKRLVSSLASSCGLWDSSPSHNSTAVDACVPDYAYDAAWTYLVTSP
jgi:pimeloyl-ACP methyl ester carboxylesterase